MYFVLNNMLDDVEKKMKKMNQNEKIKNPHVGFEPYQQWRWGSRVHPQAFFHFCDVGNVKDGL
jgi:hypothetical protein